MSNKISDHIKKNAAPDRFKTTMGLMGATTLGVGAMLGAGLYVLVGIAAKEAASLLYISYIICAVLTFFTVLMYGELSKDNPKNGGGYYYSYKRLGSFWGFMVGWHLAIGSIFACALYATGFSSYFIKFFTQSTSPILTSVVASLIITIIWLTELRKKRSDGRFIQLVTWSNVLILILIAVLGFIFFKPDNFVTPNFSFSSNIGSAISIIYISFFGFQLIANSAEEIKEPKKNVPKAMIFSLLISSAVYLIVVIAALGSVGASKLASSDAPLLLVASFGIGKYGVILIGTGGVLASFAALSSTLSSQARQIYAMGRDALLPKLIGAVTKSTGKPAMAFGTGALLSIIVVLTFNLESIAKAANFALLFSMMPVSFALVSLQKKKNEKKLFKLLLPYAALISNGLLIITMDKKSLMFGGLLIGAGCAVFLAYSRSSEIRSREGFSVSMSEKNDHLNLINKGVRILLPIGNAKTIDPLFTLSRALLPSEKSEIVALSIALTMDGTKPQVLLHERELPESVIEATKKTMNLAKKYHTNVRSVVRASKSLATGIRHAAREENCNLIVMGWTQSDDASPSELLKDVVNNTNMDFVFFNIKQKMKYKKIGVALGSYDNLSLLVKIAGMLAEQCDGYVNYFNVMPSHFTHKELLRAKDLQCEALTLHNSMIPCSTELMTTDNPLEAIIEQSRELDLLVIGSAPASENINDNLIGSFSTMIIEKSHCSVVIARRTLGFGRILPSALTNMFTYEKESIEDETSA